MSFGNYGRAIALAAACAFVVFASPVARAQDCDGCSSDDSSSSSMDAVLDQQQAEYDNLKAQLAEATEREAQSHAALEETLSNIAEQAAEQRREQAEAEAQEAAQQQYAQQQYAAQQQAEQEAQQSSAADDYAAQQQAEADRQAEAERLQAQQQAEADRIAAQQREEADRLAAQQQEEARRAEAQEAAELVLREQDRRRAETDALMSDAGGATSHSGAPSGRLMGFTGATCEQARAGAQSWVGKGGTFEVAEEVPNWMGNGDCIVRINLDTYTPGVGTASAQ